MPIEREREKKRETERETDRQIGQTDRQTDRQTDKQTDREIGRQTLDLLPACTIIIRNILKFKKASTNSISHFREKCENAKK